MKRTSAVAIAVLLCAPGLVRAQDDGDVPEKGVARLSLIHGDIKVRQGDTGDEVAGTVNAPLLAGDRVFTAVDSRAELQFDSANLIRLGPMSEVRMGDLADRRYEIHLTNGFAMIRVTRDNAAHFELDTPSVSVRPTRRGSYRVLVLPDGSSEITVRSGEAEIFTPRGSETLGAGRTMLARGDPSSPEVQVINEAAEDDFDRWNNTRDRELDRSVSSRYVPADVYGTETLDGYGSWAYDAPYGWVWMPRVDAGWAPYRQGRWSYLNYYGWSWISDDPWGWAPYHYGRWYQGNRGWAWYPGAIGPRYYWRPALVGFFGWGSGGIGIGFGNTWGFGNVGWVPLAPYEVYRPWYGRWGGRGYNNLTVVNVTSVYRNARFDRGFNGVTSVRSGDFGRGGVHNSNFVRAGERDLRNGGDTRGGVPFTPGREGRRFSDQNVSNASFPRSDENRQVFRRAAGGQTSGGNALGRDGGRDNAPIFRGGAVDPPANTRGGNGRSDNPVAGGQDRGNPRGGGFRSIEPGQSNSDRGARAVESQRNDSPRGGGFRSIDPGQSNSDRGARAVESQRNDSPRGGGFRSIDPGQSNSDRGARAVESQRNDSPRGGGFRSIDPGQSNSDRGARAVESQRNGSPRGGGFRSIDPGQSNSDRGARAVESQRNDSPRGGGFRNIDPGPSVPDRTRSFDPNIGRGSVRRESAPVESRRPTRSIDRGNYSPAPVQISPPIVRDRGDVGRSRSEAPRQESRGGGGFGSARPAQSGGGDGGGRAVQGGDRRGRNR